MARLALTLALALPITAAADDQEPREVWEGGDILFYLIEAPDAALLFAGDEPTETYALTPGCTALHNARDIGRWEWANGGWAVVFDGEVVLGFPRQDAPFGSPGRCRSGG